jgi:hypothetical protein
MSAQDHGIVIHSQRAVWHIQRRLRQYLILQLLDVIVSINGSRRFGSGQRFVTLARMLPLPARTAEVSDENKT